jgi:MYXO-CTERM domain-containing protein
MKSTILCVAALTLWYGRAWAAPIFTDTFDADAATTQTEFAGFLHWDAVVPVDYIRDSDLGVTCDGGSGGCVDLAGSTGFGKLVSKQVFAFESGVSYTATLRISGNQRSDDLNLYSIAFEYVGGPTITWFGGSLAFDEPFTTVSPGPFSPTAGLARIAISGNGTHGAGLVLDGFGLADSTPTAVPEPGILTLAALAAAGVAARRRTVRSR